MPATTPPARRPTPRRRSRARSHPRQTGGCRPGGSQPAPRWRAAQSRAGRSDGSWLSAASFRRQRHAFTNLVEQPLLQGRIGRLGRSLDALASCRIACDPCGCEDSRADVALEQSSHIGRIGIVASIGRPIGQCQPALRQPLHRRCGPCDRARASAKAVGSSRSPEVDATSSHARASVGQRSTTSFACVRHISSAARHAGVGSRRVAGRAR